MCLSAATFPGIPQLYFSRSAGVRNCKAPGEGAGESDSGIPDYMDLMLNP